MDQVLRVLAGSYAADIHRESFTAPTPQEKTICGAAGKDRSMTDNPLREDVVTLCPNCESSRHARCCSRCGKVHSPKRLHTEYCSTKCELATANADRISDAMEEDWLEEMAMREKKSNEEGRAAEIESPSSPSSQPTKSSPSSSQPTSPSHLFCRQCGEFVTEHRVYFGVVGPFCDVACRDAYAEIP
jgi:hypothetical protein